MRADDFKTTEYGDVRTDPETGLVWFDPALMSRSLELEPETLLALSKADASVGRLDGIARLLPNPGLIAGPYAAREALASARIEGTHATLSEVLGSEAGRGRGGDGEVASVENHVHALWAGLGAVRDAPLTLQTLLDVHRELMRQSGDDVSSGHWRDGDVYVGSPTGGHETAAFVPPRKDRLPALLSDWEQWHRRPPRLPVLVRVALLHYQFLTIHPFVDGNGRVGRMLAQLILEEEHALSQPLLYVSAYFAERRREYYDRLQMVRERGEMQQWLQFFLTAVHVQAEDGVNRALRLMTLHGQYRERLAGTRSRAPELIDMLFQLPFMFAARVRDELGVSNAGALNLLRTLERAGILQLDSRPGAGRAQYWVASEILDLIQGSVGSLSRVDEHVDAAAAR